MPRRWRAPQKLLASASAEVSREPDAGERAAAGKPAVIRLLMGIANKQKVGLVQAFVHQPELLILHEPTLGLEPLMPREFRALVEETVKRGATDFLSSHALSEVELLCDRVALIKKRCLVRVGTLGELRASRVHRFEAASRARFRKARSAGPW